jgi:hypothetical protein
MILSGIQAFTSLQKINASFTSVHATVLASSRMDFSTELS